MFSGKNKNLKKGLSVLITLWLILLISCTFLAYWTYQKDLKQEIEFQKERDEFDRTRMQSRIQSLPPFVVETVYNKGGSTVILLRIQTLILRSSSMADYDLTKLKVDINDYLQNVTHYKVIDDRQVMIYTGFPFPEVGKLMHITIEYPEKSVHMTRYTVEDMNVSVCNKYGGTLISLYGAVEQNIGVYVMEHNLREPKVYINDNLQNITRQGIITPSYAAIYTGFPFPEVGKLMEIRLEYAEKSGYLFSCIIAKHGNATRC